MFSRWPTSDSEDRNIPTIQPTPRVRAWFAVLCPTLVTLIGILALFLVQPGGALYLLFYLIPFVLLAMLIGTGGLYALGARIRGMAKPATARLFVLGYLAAAWCVCWALSPLVMMGVTTGRSLIDGNGVPTFAGDFLPAAYSATVPLLVVSLLVTAITVPFVVKVGRQSAAVSPL